VATVKIIRDSELPKLPAIPRDPSVQSAGSKRLEDREIPDS